jgi:NMD protein affecting ribosome stability and mRNA decay
MYPIVGMCMDCGRETHIMDGYCLNCFHKEENKDNDPE